MRIDQKAHQAACKIGMHGLPPHWLDRVGQHIQRETEPSLAVEIVNEHRYHRDVIQSFRCVDTQALFDGKRVARFANFEAVALRKLQQLNAAAKLEFLRVPPGNQLEALKRDRKGQHSIRINSQWRVCFVWNDGHANSVEIVDYH